jgi:hypothetical protein
MGLQLSMPSPSERSQVRVLSLISQLLRRPPRAERRLPLIWLSGPGSVGVLGALVERLKLPARYRVPYAYVDMIDGPDDMAICCEHFICSWLHRRSAGSGYCLSTTSWLTG